MLDKQKTLKADVFLKENRQILLHAFKYLDLGFSIIPICGPYYSKGDSQKAKSPLIKWAEFQTRKPTKEEVINWFNSYPKANIAVVTGAVSAVVVVDFDSEEAVTWAKQKGLLNTALVKTARGLHAYYRYPKDKLIRNVVNLDNMKIDIRAEGGYVVAPPSIHTNGHVYKWVKGSSITEISLAELPEIFLQKKEEDKTNIHKELKPLYKGVKEGSRNNTLAKLVGSWLNDGLTIEECKEMALLWNQQNNPPLKEEELEKTVLSIYKRHVNALSVKKSVSFFERNLLNLPLCTREKHKIHKPQKIEYVINRGKYERKWTVLGSIEYGLPSSFDEDVLLAVLKIALEKPKPIKNPINIGYLSSIAKILKIFPEGKNIQEIKKSILRLKSLILISEETFFDNNKNKFITDVFNLFDRVVFKGEIKEKGVIEKGNFVWINKTILDNINTDYLSPFFFDFYTELKSDIAKALFKMLSFTFSLNHNAPFTLYYSTLVKKIQIKEEQTISKIKEQLNQAVKELIEKKFLSTVTIKKNKKITFYPY